MASIMVLQTLHDLSDREAAEAARCDLRWKVATSMVVDHKGFDPSTLDVLARSDRPHRINDAVRQVIEQTGIHGGRRKRPPWCSSSSWPVKMSLKDSMT